MNRSASIRPGWPEFLVGLLTYLVLGAVVVVWITQMPDDQAELRGIGGMAANGIAGCVALFAANALRVRDLAAFGFRAVDARWLWISAALGLAAFSLSFLIEYVYFLFITEPNTQADFQAAAQAGPLSLLILFVAGAILTPLGEEFVFRGVVASVLNRYGAWAGVVGSAAIFAIPHGPSVIFLLAFMVGIIAGYLMRRTGSIWPGIVVHIVYNGLHLLHYSTLDAT